MTVSSTLQDLDFNEKLQQHMPQTWYQKIAQSSVNVFCHFRDQGGYQTNHITCQTHPLFVS